jgi:hypothetical protein
VEVDFSRATAPAICPAANLVEGEIDVQDIYFAYVTVDHRFPFDAIKF